MKARTVLFLCLLAAFCVMPCRAAAQNCMQPQYSTYDNMVATILNSDTQATLSVAFTLDGGGGWYCSVPLPGVAHTPTVQLSVNGSASYQTGKGVPPQYAISYTATQAGTITIGSTFELDEEAQVTCNYAGVLFDFAASFWPKAVYTNYDLKGSTTIYGTIPGIGLPVPIEIDCQYQVDCHGNWGTCELPPQYLSTTHLNLITGYPPPCGNYLRVLNIYVPALSSCKYNAGRKEESQSGSCT